MSDYLTQDTPLYMWGPYDPDGLQDSLSIIKKERTKERKKRKRKNQKGKKKEKNKALLTAGSTVQLHPQHQLEVNN